MKTSTFILVALVGIAAVHACTPGTAFDHTSVLGGGVFSLKNHPDGSARPPLYGLRLDELIPLQARIVTFDFEYNLNGNSSSMVMDYDATAKTIRISGTAYGGPDSGSSYSSGFPHKFSIDFLYTDAEILGSGTSAYLNVGPKLSDVGVITDEDTGISYNLVSSDMSNSFFRVQKGHRGVSDYSGWGWVDHSDKTHVAASDWLFTFGECVENKKACCLNGQCSLLSQADCANAGGQTLPVDVCFPGICPNNDETGACCTTDEGCKDGVTRTSCQNSAYFYPFRTCSNLTDAECPFAEGACCISGQPCIENAKPTVCNTAGGTFYGGKTCDEKCPKCDCREFKKTKSCGNSHQKSPSRCICLDISDDIQDGTCTESESDGAACPP